MLVRRRRLHPSFGSVSCKIVPFTIAITGLAAAYNDNRQWVVSCQLRSESSEEDSAFSVADSGQNIVKWFRR
jgi:hypothetical protein